MLTCLIDGTQSLKVKVGVQFATNSGNKQMAEIKMKQRWKSLLLLIPHLIATTIDQLNIKEKDANFELLLSSGEVTRGEYAQIPKIVHFIFGLKGESPPFEIEHYLAIKSAYSSIQPEVIYFWYHYEPDSELWKAVKHLVVLKHIELITSVYGNRIVHFAHMADVVRLMILHEFGGIYLDIDVVSLKPFDSLLKHDMVLGQEGKGLINLISKERALDCVMQSSYPNRLDHL